MCGRFGLTRPERLDPKALGVEEIPVLDPRWNIAPAQDVAAVLEDRGRRQLALLHWGLVPAWADDPRIGNRLANARAEGIGEKPAFRNAFRRRRCLILADVFYE